MVDDALYILVSRIVLVQHFLDLLLSELPLFEVEAAYGFTHESL